MGACITLEREEGKARKKSAEIDRQLGEFAKQQNNVIKILLLGMFMVSTVNFFKRNDFRCWREWEKYPGKTNENYPCRWFYTC